MSLGELIFKESIIIDIGKKLQKIEIDGVRPLKNLHAMMVKIGQETNISVELLLEFNDINLSTTRICPEGKALYINWKANPPSNFSKKLEDLLNS